jgi:hypothetical protein
MIFNSQSMQKKQYDDIHIRGCIENSIVMVLGSFSYFLFCSNRFCFTPGGVMSINRLVKTDNIEIYSVTLPIAGCV